MGVNQVMKEIGFIHIMRIATMPVTFLINLALTVISIELFGVPSVVSIPLLISVFFILDFLVISLTKKDTFRITADSTRFKVWRMIYKIIFIIDAIAAPLLFIMGVITTVQNILLIC